ncbi:GNAT family N-acetyltransferase [Micromonospora echinofusca]|uniref:GNAT family N-acetyltransferase n=1 Tax=Micromonospora echinofusca TaxID=47858 RepID=A0ABS3VKK7_MICEH|nr:GNAT family N-acetyltransferase [Micromonospora echinofusca]MBO4205066.1 GNAT family N-acetyltransferase [Micromonospora echinofusca]
MAEEPGGCDVGAVLRAVRRAADLSQRELAARAGVPGSTVARIESGQTGNPGFRTVEQLVRAGGARLVVEPLSTEPPSTEPPSTGPSGFELLSAGPPGSELRDRADRRYPAHLDVREVRGPRDWPGAWWAHWYDLPPERWPLPVPAAMYDLCRRRRDRRRWGERVRQAVRVRRITAGLPAGSWRFVADLPDGGTVGELRAHQRSMDLRYGHDLGDQRELVLDGVLVAPGYRLLGIGRRLVGAFVEEMDRAGIREAYAIGEAGSSDFLTACGFRVAAGRPVALSLIRRPSS